MTKNLVPILAILLVALVTGVALLIINTVTREGLPASNQKQIQELNPKLNTQLLDDLKKLPVD